VCRSGPDPCAEGIASATLYGTSKDLIGASHEPHVPYVPQEVRALISRDPCAHALSTLFRVPLPVANRSSGPRIHRASNETRGPLLPVFGSVPGTTASPRGLQLISRLLVAIRLSKIADTPPPHLWEEVPSIAHKNFEGTSRSAGSNAWPSGSRKSYFEYASLATLG
jgi:hypothetical protein